MSIVSNRRVFDAVHHICLMKLLVRLACVAILSILTACSTTANSRAEKDVDRFVRINRATHKFNAGFDRFIFKPVAKTYDRVLPGVVDRRFRKFFMNLRSPIDIVNNLLQGKPVRALSSVGRFAINSTAGVGGLFDPAERLGLEPHAEDFGQTLGKWGVPTGPYLVLPFLGPSTIRDAFGIVAGWQLHPVSHVEDTGVRNTLVVFGLLVRRVELLPFDRTKEIAFDEYIYVREAYLQQRLYELYDGSPPADDEYLREFLFDTDD